MLVGLTGNSGSGQTEAARSVAGLVVETMSLDMAGHEVLSGTGVLERAALLTGAGDLSGMDFRDARRAIGARVFVRPDLRLALEEMVHPLIRRRVEVWAAGIAGRSGVFLLEGALLVELGLDGLTDAVVVVACDEETCVRRSMERDGVEEGIARGRIAAQLPLTRRLVRADWVLSNHGGAPLWNLQSQARAVFSRLAADSKTEG